MFGLLCTAAVVSQRALPPLAPSQARWVGLQNLALCQPKAKLGQPQTQYLVWPEIQQNKQQVWGVFFWSRVTFSLPLPNLGFRSTWIFGNFHPLWRAGTLSTSVTLHWDGFVLEVGASVKEQQLQTGLGSLILLLFPSCIPGVPGMGSSFPAGAEPGAAFGPTGMRAAVGCSGLCPLSCCPFMSCGKGKGFFQRFLEKKLVFATDTLCPVSRDTPNPGSWVCH